MPPPLLLVTHTKPYLIRRAKRDPDPKKSDIPFICNSWLESFRDADWVRGCPNSAYYGYHHAIIDQLLPRSVVLCAVNEDDINQILGWVCAELVAASDDSKVLVIHYIYVKETFRRLGVARTMVETMIATEKPAAIMYTHKTRLCPKMRLRDKGLIYNPYLLMTTMPEGWDEAA